MELPYRACSPVQITELPAQNDGCWPRCPHFIIEELAQLMNTSVSAPYIDRHLLLIDQMLAPSQPSAFFLSDLPELIMVLNFLGDHAKEVPEYADRLYLILERCRVPPVMIRSSQIMYCERDVQEYVSCLGFLLITCDGMLKYQDLLIDVLMLLVDHRDRFSRCHLPDTAVTKVIAASDMPCILSELVMITRDMKTWERLLDLAMLFIHKDKRITLTMLGERLVNHMLLSRKDIEFKRVRRCLCSEDGGKCCRLFHKMSTLMLMMATELDKLPQASKDKVLPPDVEALWCLRNIFCMTLSCQNENVITRNNVLAAIYLWRKNFNDFSMIHSGIGDEICTLAVICLGGSDPCGDQNCPLWIKYVRIHRSERHFITARLLMMIIHLSSSTFSFASMFIKRHMMEAFVCQLKPSCGTMWGGLQYIELVQYILLCCEVVLPLCVGQFIECGGIARLSDIMKQQRDNPANNQLLMVCIKIFMYCMENSNILMIQQIVECDLEDTLLTISMEFLKRHLLTMSGKTSMAYCLNALNELYYYQKVQSPKVWEFIQLYLAKIMSNLRTADVYYNPVVLILTLLLLKRTVMFDGSHLRGFISSGGVYNILDLIDAPKTNFKPLLLVLLNILIDLCEHEASVPYIVTWRKQGKNIIQKLVQLFRGELHECGVYVDMNGLILDVEQPLTSRRNGANDPSLTYIPTILDMMGNMQPKIFAILFMLANYHRDVVEIVNKRYQICLQDLSAEDQITHILCMRYLELKQGQSWKEISNEICNCRLIASDAHLVHQMLMNYQAKTMELQQIQIKILNDSKEQDLKHERSYYSEIRNAKLTESLEALQQMKRFAEATNATISSTWRLKSNLCLHDDTMGGGDHDVTFHETFMSHFNARLGCNQEISMQTDCLVSKTGEEMMDVDTKEDSKEGMNVMSYRRRHSTVLTDEALAPYQPVSLHMMGF